MAKRKIKITYLDGSVKEFEAGVTGKEIASQLGEGMVRSAVGLMVDGKIQDLKVPLTKSAEIKILTFKDPEGVEIFRHSTAHLMAQAIMKLFPEAKLTIGPVIEDGFYYDVDHPPFKEEDLIRIEDEMKMLAKQDLKIERKEITKREALKLFKDNPYKIEIIKNVDEFGEGKTADSDMLSIYTQGDFTDLCRGPHLPRTGMIKAFRLTKLAGAYWRGDSKNKQLQRIYGISFPDKKELKEYLLMIEEAEKRNHRKIGNALDLFSFHEVSPGAPFFHPKGTVIYRELINFLQTEYAKRGYEEVITPLLYEKSLWETSGHWEHFKDDMFTLNIDGRDFSLKPMNCPSHLLMYKMRTRSYRDLPWRIADFAVLHRNELRGVLGGLTRVRKFSQDDAHIFCTPEQVYEEMKKLLEFVKYIYTDVFGFEYSLSLSTRPDKAMGDSKLWEEAEEMLKNVLQKLKIDYRLDPGEGAFYGPKIDITVRDSLGREWQLATIQLDRIMPTRFGATYEGADGQKHTPIMIHRAILGSLERFIAILTEHYAGKFPLWISPVQVKILTIADRHETYGDRVAENLKVAGLRIEKDYRAETLNKKIREAQLEQVNYIVVIGDREADAEKINVRTRDNKVLGEVSLDDFKDRLVNEVRFKKNS